MPVASWGRCQDFVGTPQDFVASPASPAAMWNFFFGQIIDDDIRTHETLRRARLSDKSHKILERASAPESANTGGGEESSKRRNSDVARST